MGTEGRRDAALPDNGEVRGATAEVMVVVRVFQHQRLPADLLRQLQSTCASIACMQNNKFDLMGGLCISGLYISGLYISGLYIGYMSTEVIGPNSEDCIP